MSTEIKEYIGKCEGISENGICVEGLGGDNWANWEYKIIKAGKKEEYSEEIKAEIEKGDIVRIQYTTRGKYFNLVGKPELFELPPEEEPETIEMKKGPEDMVSVYFDIWKILAEDRLKKKMMEKKNIDKDDFEYISLSAKIATQKFIEYKLELLEEIKEGDFGDNV